MLEVIGAAPGSHTEIDWHEAWKASPERAAVKQELAHLKGNPKQLDAPSKADKWAYREFAAPMSVQYFEVTKRFVDPSSPLRARPVLALDLCLTSPLLAPLLLLSQRLPAALAQPHLHLLEDDPLRAGRESSFAQLKPSPGAG